MLLGRVRYMPNKPNKCIAIVVFECSVDLSEMDACRYFEPHVADPKLCISFFPKGDLKICTREAAMKDAVANRRMSNYAKRILTL